MGLEGVLHFWSETGTEGGYWAFQDKNFITPNTTYFVCAKCGKVWDKQKNPTGVYDCIPPQCLPDDHNFQLLSKERWSYDGLHVLEDGDVLTIYSKEDPTKIVWTGVINLKPCPLFTEDAYGMWIHTDQDGIDRNTWARWFMEERPAKLVKIRPRD